MLAGLMQLTAQLGALSDLVLWIRPLTSGTEGGNVLKKGGGGGRGEVEEEEGKKKKKIPPRIFLLKRTGQ